MIHAIAKSLAVTLVIIVLLFAFDYGWVVQKTIHVAEGFGQNLHATWCKDYPVDCKPKPPTQNKNK